jgi:hypothetical protein
LCEATIQAFFGTSARRFPENEVRMGKKHNKARGTNRRGRGRRTKVNFRARSGQSDRTVAALAKTPTAQILTISNVPSDILEAIDEIAVRQDRSRSSFVRRELQRVVADYQAKDALRRPMPRN